MMQVSSSPLLGIRMSDVVIPSQTDLLDRDGFTDSLHNLIKLEECYTCGDYLTRERAEILHGTEESKRDEVNPLDDPNAVDPSCREKMCEWSYRVCDHFKVPRNIVAVAFSFLDRFVNRCSCDRTAFKLASMTALYMATKLFNGRQLSIATLAELSRGEFDTCHISEMEQIMLRTLDWKLNPPTVQDFIQYFLTFLPSNYSQSSFIALRAMFFAELAVYDYDLILHNRGVIAQAAVLNAIHAVFGEEISAVQKMESMFLDALQHFYPSESDKPQNLRRRRSDVLVQNTQRRLWYLFSCSAQSVEEKSLTQMNIGDDQKISQTDNHRKPQEPKSPTSVHQVASVSPVCVTGDNRF